MNNFLLSKLEIRVQIFKTTFVWKNMHGINLRGGGGKAVVKDLLSEILRGIGATFFLNEKTA